MAAGSWRRDPSRHRRGAAWLVKPNALLAAFPFAIWGMVCALRALRAGGLRAAALPALAAAAPLAAVVAAEAMRRGPFGLDVHFGSDDVYIYPLAGEWLDRALNPLRALGYHLGAAPDALRELAPWLAPPCASGIGCGFHPLRPHEDYAGNPVHALLFLAACALVLARWRNAPLRARCTLFALAAGWGMLSVVFRSNAWVSRLHTPLFLVGVAGVAAVLGSLRDRGGQVLRVAAAGAALLLAFRTALGNETRPPHLDPSEAPDAATSYYTALPALRPSHDLALRALKTTGCSKLGLWFPGAADESFGEAWDYPLTWRARVAGEKVRTMVGPDDWPCLVYSTSGTPPSGEGEPPWVAIHPRIYVRATGG